MTIPNSVTSIGSYAFYGCNGLMNVYVSIGDVDRIRGLMQKCRLDVTSINFVEVAIGFWTVHFDANGGSVGESIRRVIMGNAVGELPVPVRTGYMFAGWWTSMSGGTQVSASTVTMRMGGKASRYGQSSWVETIVSGPCEFSFWYKVSSEAGYDELHWYLDGIEQGSPISGDRDWTQVVTMLSSGAHTVKWEYKKNDSKSSGLDCAWLGDVAVTPAVVVTFDANGVGNK